MGTKAEFNMALWNKQLGSIVEDDLQALRIGQYAEAKRIEYKQPLPDNMSSNKKEFLADVSSFANAVGGDLVFGIKEDHGVPVEICGIEISDLDTEIRRLELIILDGIRPRI